MAFRSRGPGMVRVWVVFRCGVVWMFRGGGMKGVGIGIKGW